MSWIHVFHGILNMDYILITNFDALIIIYS